MKKVKNIIILIGLFIIALISILLVFKNDIENIRLANKAKELVKYIYSLNEDNYYYKNGVLYDSKSNIISTSYYINGEGNIIKDKYNNVKMLIILKDRCIMKTSLGKVNTYKECSNSYNLTPTITKNNTSITFSFNGEIDSYKLSRKDDFDGNFISLNNDSLVLNLFNAGEYFIWFKDSNGNLSETITFTIECLNTLDAVYDKNTLYCSASVVTIDNYKWIVISDKDKEITLMRLDSLENQMSHGENEYKWSTSEINKYLNGIYINTLSEEVRNSLMDVSVCDTPSGTEGCDSNDGCGGYKEKTITKYKWTCDTYTTSKIRIISYDEYSTLYDSLTDKDMIFDNYWTINSYKESMTGVSINNNGEVFLGEAITNKLYVKPVITLKR